MQHNESVNGTDIKVLEVKVENVTKDVEHVRQEIKEVKTEIKEQNRVVVETLTVMRDNITKLTVLAEKQDTQLDFLRKEVKELRERHEEKKEQEDKNWYRKTIETNGKLIWYVLLILLASVLGYKIHDIASVLFHIS
jgi:hypothetical protein